VAVPHGSTSMSKHGLGSNGLLRAKEVRKGAEH
jgi:hypothetical protein